MKSSFPVIYEAMDLMTSKFDRNLNYRQKLTKGNGTDIEFLKTTEGILTITLPSVSGIFKYLHC